MMEERADASEEAVPEDSTEGHLVAQKPQEKSLALNPPEDTRINEGEG